MTEYRTYQLTKIDAQSARRFAFRAGVPSDVPNRFLAHLGQWFALRKRAALGITSPSERPTRRVLDAGQQQLQNERKQHGMGSAEPAHPAPPLVTVETSPNPENSRKVWTQLLNAAAHAKWVNSVRYALALSLIDERKAGRVLFSEAVETLSSAFGVGRKTAARNLRKVVQRGLGYFSWDGQYIHYHKQERMAAKMGAKITSRHAATLTLADLSADVVAVRALFYDASLSVSESAKTRSTIKGIAGRTKRTQRKYEAKRGIEKRFNYAHFGTYNEYDFTRLRAVGHPVFVFTDYTNRLGAGHDVKHIMKHHASNYFGTVAITKRTMRGIRNVSESLPMQPLDCPTGHSADNSGNEPNTEKVHFDDSKAALREWNRTPTKDVYAAEFDSTSTRRKSSRCNLPYGVLSTLEAITPEMQRGMLA